MFNSYLQKLQNTIKEHGGKSQPLKDIFSQCVSERKQGIIRSSLWKVPGFHRWRITSLDAGDSLQVLNSVAYPDYTNDQPILGIDLLWFGKTNKLVAVLDFQPLLQENDYFERHYEGLKKLNIRFSALNNSEAMNAYDPTQYFSPWLLFCRGGLEHAHCYLPEAFNAFLDCYWDLQILSGNRSSLIQPDEVRRLHDDYNKYGIERDPAHGLFKSYFGEAWTERFLNEFLFPVNK